GKARKSPEILALAKTDQEARAAIANHCSRLARGLATVVNLFDPEVIVLGGGLSAMPHLYKELAEKMTRFIFSANKIVDIRPPVHGDASGVRGAARLWRDGGK
ncbi:MAG: ROK family protein, partial [Alphaproteobacteria bacterium]